MEVGEFDTKKLEQMYKKEEDSKAKLRLLALLHRCDGKSYQEIGEMIKTPFTTVRDWIKRIEKGGLDEIYDGEKAGRPPKLSSEERKRLRDDLVRGPKAFGHKQENWTTRLVKNHISKNYGVTYSLRNVRRILRKL